MIAYMRASKLIGEPGTVEPTYEISPIVPSGAAILRIALTKQYANWSTKSRLATRQSSDTSDGTDAGASCVGRYAGFLYL